MRTLALIVLGSTLVAVALTREEELGPRLPVAQQLGLPLADYGLRELCPDFPVAPDDRRRLVDRRERQLAALERQLLTERDVAVRALVYVSDFTDSTQQYRWVSLSALAATHIVGLRSIGCRPEVARRLQRALS